MRDALRVGKVGLVDVMLDPEVERACKEERRLRRLAQREAEGAEGLAQARTQGRSVGHTRQAGEMGGKTEEGCIQVPAG